jgi:hypothetical protein
MLPYLPTLPYLLRHLIPPDTVPSITSHFPIKDAHPFVEGFASLVHSLLVLSLTELLALLAHTARGADDFDLSFRISTRFDWLSAESIAPSLGYGNVKSVMDLCD